MAASGEAKNIWLFFSSVIQRGLPDILPALHKCCENFIWKGQMSSQWMQEMSNNTVQGEVSPMTLDKAARGGEASPGQSELSRYDWFNDLDDLYVIRIL